MTGTTPTRPAVKRKLIDVYRSEITDDGLSVTYTPPNGHLPRKAIFLGMTTGEMDPGPMQAGRLQYDDRFIVNVVFAVTTAGVADGEEPDEAAWALFEQAYSYIAEHPTMEGQVAGLQSITLAQVHGPDADPFELGFASVVVAEHAIWHRARAS